MRAAPRAVRPGRRGHHAGPPDPRVQPVRRQERGGPGRGCPRRQAAADPAAAPAGGGRRVHLLASPAGLQGAPCGGGYSNLSAQAAATRGQAAPTPRPALALANPYPDLEENWGDEDRAWGWTLVPGNSIPGLRP